MSHMSHHTCHSKNVLLLGDSRSDVRMCEGYPCENVLSIGFLNHHIEENLQAYMACQA